MVSAWTCDKNEHNTLTLTMQVVTGVSKRPSIKREATIGEVRVDGDVDQYRVEQDDVTGAITVVPMRDGTALGERTFDATEQLYQGITTSVPRRKIDDTMQDALLELGFCIVDGSDQ